MKKYLAISLASSLVFSFSSPLLAENSANSEDSTPKSSVEIQVETSVESLLKNNSPVDAMTNFALVDPTNAPLGLKAIYTAKPESSLYDLVMAAFQAAPNRALPIANMAIQLGLDPTLLPELALASNIDPTLIAQATAAGGDDGTTNNVAGRSNTTSNRDRYSEDNTADTAASSDTGSDSSSDTGSDSSSDTGSDSSSDTGSDSSSDTGSDSSSDTGSDSSDDTGSDSTANNGSSVDNPDRDDTGVSPS